MSEEMTLGELKQIAIDTFVNLMRIKKFQKETNPELEYQIKVAKTKLQALSIPTEDLEKF